MKKIISECDCSELAQFLEDMRIDNYIESEVYRLYDEWRNAKEIEFEGIKFRNYICIPKPCGFYTIHNEKSAKYYNADINDIVIKKYGELIKQTL